MTGGAFRRDGTFKRRNSHASYTRPGAPLHGELRRLSPTRPSAPPATPSRRPVAVPAPPPEPSFLRARRALSPPRVAPLALLLGTGIRWSEAVRAQARDVEHGRLVIRRSKSGRVRRVPLSPELLAECTGRVGRLCPYSDSCSFNKRVRELSGIERFRSHLCRHTFATEWRAAGGSLAALQAVLGHSTVAVTERYGTVGEDLVEREALRLVQYRAQAQGEG